MSIRHLFGSDDWYIISLDRDDEPKVRPGWHHRGVWLHGPDIEAHAEWNLFSRGFGWGVQFGRNGSESDMGLNVYVGRLASMWFRLRSPWTKWANVKHRRDNWYYARHTGFRFFPHRGRIFEIEIENLDGHWSKDQPWWREIALTTTQILGRKEVDKHPMEIGACQVPLPEGNYFGTYATEKIIHRHVRYPGKFLDWFGKKSWIRTEVEVPGGIPVQGKGENSYDCGMDGIFSTSAPGRVEDVVASMAASVQRDRNRYGGPHDLTEPTSVSDAS